MRKRKNKQSRQPRKLFLVVCEGETEEEYVGLLRSYFRLPIVIKTKVCGNAVNRRLVKQYLKELGEEEYGESKVFFIYDADDPIITYKLQTLPGKVILSNPCFEFWYILHSKVSWHALSSADTVRLLRQINPVWKGYKKGVLTLEQGKYLLERMNSACENAEKLKWHENPSSNMNIFIEDLKSENS
ncbi:MAG: RloB family protein [Muribaculaceae bacterium]|nr:RloB family protein [Muribaculaceae bacterium]MDE6753191.1 RloB family protein [Muribaculaceae bacterium]